MSFDTATNISNAQVQQQIAIAVAKKSLNAARQQGDAAVQLIQAAAQISAQPSGRGASVIDPSGHIDVTA